MHKKLIILSLLVFSIYSKAQVTSLVNREAESHTALSSRINSDYSFNISYNYSEETKVTPTGIDPYSVYPPTKRDYKRLGVNTTLFMASTVIAFGVLWVLPEEVTNWDKEKMKEEGIFYKWEENVKAGPVMDEDDFFLNYVTHPWAGAVYYMTARSSGFKWYDSFAYSFIMSTFFWEYGIEAFAEVPSKQDLIITPVIGSMLGEGCVYIKREIVKRDRRILKSRVLGITTLFLMDPYNTILDGCGYQSKKKVETSFLIMPNYNPKTQSAIWSANLTLNF